MTTSNPFQPDPTIDHIYTIDIEIYGQRQLLTPGLQS